MAYKQQTLWPKSVQLPPTSEDTLYIHPQIISGRERPLGNNWEYID